MKCAVVLLLLYDGLIQKKGQEANTQSLCGRPLSSNGREEVRRQKSNSLPPPPPHPPNALDRPAGWSVQIYLATAKHSPFFRIYYPEVGSVTAKT
jgi:hypothetical protein